MAGTLALPKAGEKNETADAKVLALLEEFNNMLNSENKVVDTSLASPNNSAYRPIVEQTCIGAVTTTLKGAASTGLQTAFSAANGALAAYLVPADYEVAGKSTKLLLRWQILFSGTASEEPTLTGGLYKVESGTGLIAASPVAGSTSTISTVPASWTGTLIASGASDFAIPAQGHYVFGVKTNKGSTISVPLGIQLAYRNV